MLTPLNITRLLRVVLAATAVTSLIWWGVDHCFGIWIPDVGTGRISVLASAETADGHRFRIVQFWGSDFYTTQLEETAPDGSVSTAVIESDARKVWRCVVQVVEAEKKLVIDLPDGGPPVEYSWKTRWFLLPPGQQRARA